MNRRVAFWTVLSGMVALVVVLRIAQVNALADQGTFVKYTVLADQIVAGDMPWERLGDVSPAYLWTIVALRSCFGSSAGLARSVQIAALGFVALMAAAIAHRMAGPAGGALAALAVLTNRAALVNATEIEPETMILALNSAGLALALTPGGRWQAWCRGLAGIAFGCSVATRPAALLPLLGIGLWLLLSDGARARHPSASDAPRATRLRQSLPLPYAAGALVPIAAILFLQYHTTGSVILMNPGFVFIEGMNPRATGFGGVDPRVVKDIERTVRGPDALHIAYRVVAARATSGGAPAVTRESNQYWSGKAIAFLRRYPKAALALTLEKLRLSVSSHEVYDLSTMKRKDGELRRWPWIPSGVLFSLALVALWLGRRMPETWTLATYSVCTGVVLPLFYVSARQRNPLVLSASVLAAAGAVRIVAELRRRPRSRAMCALALAVVGSVATSVETSGEREDEYSWIVVDRSSAVQEAAGAALRNGDRRMALRFLVDAATWPAEPIPAVPAGLLDARALELLRAPCPVERRFDLGLALARAGDWKHAEQVFGEVQEVGYRPMGENRETCSVAYHRARALLHLARLHEARALIERAAEEAPGDADVLALSAVCHEAAGRRAEYERTLRTLAAVHDPFTADEALAKAYWDAGRGGDSLRLIEQLQGRLPEWGRPRELVRQMNSLARMEEQPLGNSADRREH